MKRLVVPALLLVLAACHKSPPALDDFGAVPRFQLTAPDGSTFDSGSLRGKVWVADFFFTSCGSICPMMSSHMHHIQESVRDVGNAQLVSFSIDPWHDTPAVLTEYAKTYKADPARWHLLTGPQATLQKLDKDVFKLGNVDGSLQHSPRFVLVDRNGHIRGYYDTTEPASIPKIIADLRALAESGA
ncbi:MAG TPA: SCO family protein [Bryobacteraceae bacterium]|nr:SCO family protein [Bryobacteraceae bacterium]